MYCEIMKIRYHAKNDKILNKTQLNFIKLFDI